MAFRGPLLAALLALALLTMLPAPAQAQSQSQLTIQLQAPEAVLTHEASSITLTGITTFVGDATYYARMSGVPISYAVEKQPAWASVTISPSSDVIPIGMIGGPTVQAVRAFQVTVVLDPAFVGQSVDQLAVSVTQHGESIWMGASAKIAVPLTADASEPCDEAEHADLLVLASQAAERYAREHGEQGDAATDVGSGRPAASDPELITQDTDAKPLALPWIAVAGFALVGAGVGLVMRRRFR